MTARRDISDRKELRRLILDQIHRSENRRLLQRVPALRVSDRDETDDLFSDLLARLERAEARRDW